MRLATGARPCRELQFKPFGAHACSQHATAETAVTYKTVLPTKIRITARLISSEFIIGSVERRVTLCRVGFLGTSQLDSQARWSLNAAEISRMCQRPSDRRHRLGYSVTIRIVSPIILLGTE